MERLSSQINQNYEQNSFEQLKKSKVISSKHSRKNSLQNDLVKLNKNPSKVTQMKHQSIRSQINPNFFKQTSKIQQHSQNEQNSGLLIVETLINNHLDMNYQDNLAFSFEQNLNFDDQMNRVVSQKQEKYGIVSNISGGVVTSDKPLKLAWILENSDLISNLKFKPQFQHLIDQQIQTETNAIGKFALSQCPGKKIERGRDGKRHDRDIFRDVEWFRQISGITLIICLLNDSELRSLGVKVQDYQRACEVQGINLYKYPIIEMAPPEDVALFHKEVVEVVVSHLLSNQGNVLMHCRGGVGRAGLLACCILAYFCEFISFKKIIEFMRKRRDKRCVESRKQEDFVKAYFNFINQK